jgi:hypothetical protein
LPLIDRLRQGLFGHDIHSGGRKGEHLRCAAGRRFLSIPALRNFEGLTSSLMPA